MVGGQILEPPEEKGRGSDGKAEIIGPHPLYALLQGYVGEDDEAVKEVADVDGQGPPAKVALAQAGPGIEHRREPQHR